MGARGLVSVDRSCVGLVRWYRGDILLRFGSDKFLSDLPGPCSKRCMCGRAPHSFAPRVCSGIHGHNGPVRSFLLLKWTVPTGDGAVCGGMFFVGRRRRNSVARSGAALPPRLHARIQPPGDCICHVDRCRGGCCGGVRPSKFAISSRQFARQVGLHFGLAYWPPGRF